MKKIKARKNLILVGISIIIIFSGIYFYTTYSKIETNPSNYEARKLISTENEQIVENIEEKSRKISDVVEEVTHSVVGISKLKNAGNTIFSNSNEASLGIGTGIIVTDNGYILSNEHVTGKKYSTCYITLENGSFYDGTVMWSDSDLDLSIIKINAKNLSYAKLGNSKNIKVGESVFAIGNPIGFEFRRTVTSGIISAKNRTIKLQEENKEVYMSNLIQTDATINPGNSGGPLIYPNGEVIGINTVKITSAEGIGFAVPIDVIKNVIEKFKQNDKFEEATIGIYAYDNQIIPYINSNHISFTQGIYVSKIIINGPADSTELKEGDIINSIDGIEVTTMNDLKSYIYSKNINDEVNLKITRGKLNKNVNIKLGKK
ncbi:MAG: trypsin-like peptidase domain-containing protein [Clostridia bacterium]|nr:trypsin-like peptidase domain-containing protein [Clostridia bacterium]